MAKKIVGSHGSLSPVELPLQGRRKGGKIRMGSEVEV